jgi:polysaccharide export outer membrane protein
MPTPQRGKLILRLGAVWMACLLGFGCQVTLHIKERCDEKRPPASIIPNPRDPNCPSCHAPDGGANPASGLLPDPNQPPPEPRSPLPTEIQKVAHPPYVVEPPDILLIDAVRLVPRPPYRIEPLDVLIVQVSETFPNQPIAGAYTVSPEGTIALGFSYGTVRIAGLTVEQAEVVIRNHLSKVLKDPKVSVALGQFRGLQQIRGEHLVRQDGTIGLGTYGCVFVTGLNLCQAKQVIERHLSQYLQDPEISLDVLAYNSKVYYVIFDGGGFGQQVYRFPITGNETVLDAIGNAAGLTAVSSRKRIWVARPSPANHECDQVLPVDWRAITEGGSTATNYQLFPGDRIYVKADKLIEIDNALAKVIAPIERLLGVTLLGTAVVRQFSNSNRNNNNNNGLLVVP